MSEISKAGGADCTSETLSRWTVAKQKNAGLCMQLHRPAFSYTIFYLFVSIVS